MTDWYSHQRIVQLIPAQPGWRVVQRVYGVPEDELQDASLEALVWVEPVACFGLVARWESLRFEEEFMPDEEGFSRRRRREVEPIAREEMSLIAVDNPLALLAPGEELDESIRNEVIRDADLCRAANERRRVLATVKDDAAGSGGEES